MAEVSFDRTWNWNSAAYGAYEDNRAYPRSPELFFEVQDGTTDTSLVFSEHINKVQLAILDTEKHTQYTAETASPSSFIYIVKNFVTPTRLRRPSLQRGQRVSVPFNFSGDSNVANIFVVPGTSYAQPFHTMFACMCSALIYNIATGTRVYRPASSAVNVTGVQSCVVNVQSDSPFGAGDVVEATLAIIRT